MAPQIQLLYGQTVGNAAMSQIQEPGAHTSTQQTVI